MQPLSLPLSPDVSPPATHRLTIAEVYNKETSKPQPEVLKKHFVQEGRLEEEAALKIIHQGSIHFFPNLSYFSVHARNGGTSQRGDYVVYRCAGDSVW